MGRIIFVIMVLQKYNLLGKAVPSYRDTRLS